jgi:hypothetical protein
MQYAKDQRVKAICPQWGYWALPGTILHSLNGLHYGTYYRVQPDDLNLPIGNATPDQITPIEEPIQMTSQTLRVGDYVEYSAAWLPDRHPVTVFLAEIDPEHAPFTHAIKIGDRYSWVKPSELGRVIAPASGRAAIQSLAVCAPELFPVGGKTHD